MPTRHYSAFEPPPFFIPSCRSGDATIGDGAKDRDATGQVGLGLSCMCGGRNADADGAVSLSRRAHICEVRAPTARATALVAPAGGPLSRHAKTPRASSRAQEISGGGPARAGPVSRTELSPLSALFSPGLSRGVGCHVLGFWGPTDRASCCGRARAHARTGFCSELYTASCF